MAKRTKKPKTALKPTPKKHSSSADRAKILAETRSAGLTTKQAAKMYGISIWTIYGWRKRTTAGTSVTRRKRERPAPGRPSRSPRAFLRPMNAQMVREELARLVG